MKWNYWHLLKFASFDSMGKKKNLCWRTCKGKYNLGGALSAGWQVLKCQTNTDHSSATPCLSVFAGLKSPAHWQLLARAEGKTAGELLCVYMEGSSHLQRHADTRAPRRLPRSSSAANLKRVQLQCSTAEAHYWSPIMRFLLSWIFVLQSLNK